MAHRSRVGVICIDCKTEDLSPAAEYWSAMLGMECTIDPDGRYAQFGGYKGYPKILLQSVDHEPRVHLDIETDDREAEAERLAGLGAKEVARIKSWIVMEAPTGHRFCLVEPQGDDFPGGDPINAREFG